jgi:lysozyme
MSDPNPTLDPALIAAVKGFEGFTPKASWDYKQHSNGYGTRAQSPGETIDRATAEQRLTGELGKAQAQVDSLGVPMPPGVRNALTSLTYNSGPGWMQSGLGAAVRAGDWDKARGIFLTYNHAGGQVNSGLTARRQAEAGWFDQPAVQEANAGAPVAGFQAIPPASIPAPPSGAMPAPLPPVPSFQAIPQQEAPNMPVLGIPQQLRQPPDMRELLAFLQSQGRL